MTENLNAGNPKISVILSVYNGETYLDECLRSICEQTFVEFELIVVDDASTDGTPEILRRHAAQDLRIIVLTNERNKERSVSRNIALAHARADLVAIMDADDIALPDRLAKQFAFMCTNPDVLVCGGALTCHETGENIYYPMNDEAIRTQLLWASPFAHSAVMFRRNPVLETGGYDPAMPFAEDYDLWSRLAVLHSWRFANLDEVLIRYRIHPHADRRMYHARLRECALAIMKSHMLRLGIPETVVDMEAHLKLFFQDQPRDVSLERVQGWVAYLMEWNRRACIFAPHGFEKLCLQKFNELCLHQINDRYAQARWLPAGVKQLLPSSVKSLLKKMLSLQNRLRIRLLSIVNQKNYKK